jgi:hypothetical protein
MDQETTEDLWTQIERCRRIASMMTDDEIRHALEQLAREYEAELPPCDRGGFMLRNPAQQSRRGAAPR